MGTRFDKIINRAVITLMDSYKLDNLRADNEQVYLDYMSSYIANAIDKFDGCLGSLAYSSVTEGTKTYYQFDRELSSKEEYILALGLAMGYYRKELDDVTVYSALVGQKEFKDLASKANLQARQRRLAMMEEEFDQEVCNYQLKSMGNGMGFWEV